MVQFSFGVGFFWFCIVVILRWNDDQDNGNGRRGWVNINDEFIVCVNFINFNGIYDGVIRVKEVSAKHVEMIYRIVCAR